MKKTVNWKLLLLSALVLIPVVIVLAMAFGHDPHEVPFLLTGRRAPDFNLRRLDNDQNVRFAAFAGKPLVLNFWASWCAPCKAEHPVLEWGQQKLGDKAQFVGVVYEDTDENVRAYLKENPSKYTQLIDPKGRVGVDYGLSGVPETYFISKEGVIVHKHIGPIDAETLVTQIAAIADLNQPASQAAAPASAETGQ